GRRSSGVVTTSLVEATLLRAGVHSNFLKDRKTETSKDVIPPTRTPSKLSKKLLTLCRLKLVLRLKLVGSGTLSDKFVCRFINPENQSLLALLFLIPHLNFISGIQLPSQPFHSLLEKNFPSLFFFYKPVSQLTPPATILFRSHYTAGKKVSRMNRNVISSVGVNTLLHFMALHQYIIYKKAVK
ncbi:hypothetical protein L9F63_006006, partial [Diploptera punctata]